MPAKTRSVKGPIISGIVIGAVMLSPAVPSIVSAVEDMVAADEATTPTSTDTSRNISSEERDLNKRGRNLLIDNGYRDITLVSSTPKNPANAYDGITMAFNARALGSADIEIQVVGCEPVIGRVNPTKMICSLRPA